MKRIAFTYGASAGAIIIGTIIVSLRLADHEHGGGGGEWLGYLVMILALSVIFVGIKRYRDRELGGVIQFRTAAALGLAITLVASTVYVAAWEVHLAVTDYAFIHDYTQSVLAHRQEEGMTGPEFQAEVDRMALLEQQYAKPIYRLPMTFLEIFPVGVLITLVAAATLRRSEFLPASP